MPGKTTEGFTKVAQRQKFIRHRDIKLGGREIAREQHILQKTKEGVCRRCREKLQWRFQYDKYKPLSAVAKCQQCKRRCVTKAYRTWCDQCASTRQVCPGCCKPFEEGDVCGEEEQQEEIDEEEVSTARKAQLWEDICGGGTGKKEQPMMGSESEMDGPGWREEDEGEEGLGREEVYCGEGEDVRDDTNLNCAEPLSVFSLLEGEGK